jgi:hypothetical protein
MSPRLSPFQCVAAGFLATVLQAILALVFAKADGSLGNRYLALVQHDSYWFANIIDRGYGTTVPPIERKEMEVSNVAFFPAYPIFAGAIKRLTGLGTAQSLLLVAQALTWGFWTYFFLFCRRWELSLLLQSFGALAIVAHPAAFFLVAGYSESLFLFSLTGFIYWSMSGDRGATVLAVLHGIIMSATRIVGLPCAILPVVRAWFQGDDFSRNNFGRWLLRFRRPIVVMFLSMFGGLAFFTYCQVRWSRWDMYMLTQSEGWAIEPDYLAVFKPENYQFALPPLYDGRAASQFTSALAGVLFLLIAIVELGSACLGRRDWRERFGFYLSAGIIYYISVSGVASVGLESMLRYDLCVHALIVLGALHFLRNVRLPSRFARAVATVSALIVFTAALGLQAYYVWNFTQGNWVA